jgi:hypothetical protein
MANNEAAISPYGVLILDVGQVTMDLYGEWQEKILFILTWVLHQLLN